MHTLARYLILLQVIHIYAPVKSNSVVDRIAGGKIAKKGQFPFFAQLEIHEPYNATYFEKAICSASLFHPQWIVTAGHCLDDTYMPIESLEKKLSTIVYMGTNNHFGSDAIQNTIKKVTHHPQFVNEIDSDGVIIELTHDIAIAQLSFPYIENKYVQVIKLPTPDMKRCKYGKIVGGGLKNLDPPTISKHILYATIKAKSINELQEKLPKPTADTLFYSEVQWLHGHTLPGDSGGPFVCYYNNTPYLFGITSKGKRTRYGTEISAYEDITKQMDFMLMETKSTSRDSRYTIFSFFIVYSLGIFTLFISVF